MRVSAERQAGVADLADIVARGQRLCDPLRVGGVALDAELERP